MTEVLASVPPLHAVDLRDSEQIDFVLRLLRRSPPAIRYYLWTDVFPNTLLKSDAQLTASGQELGGPQLGCVRLGFSGTPNDMLPSSMGTCVYAQGDDGRMISTLTSADVVGIRVVERGWTVRSLLELVSAGPYTALIDCGALVTGMSNYEVARELLKLGLAEFAGVVFLTSDGERCVLMRDSERVLKLEQCGLAPKQRFSYYDHAHTTGMDIVQPIRCTACLTLGKDMTFRDAAQGAYRMRRIGGGQRVEFLVPPEVAARVQDGGAGIDPTSVVKWLVSRSFSEVPPLARLLIEQNAASVWRCSALRSLQRSAGGSADAAAALTALRLPVSTDVSNTADRACVDPVEAVRIGQRRHAQWVSASGAEVLDQLVLRLADLKDVAVRETELEREQVQEQEEQQEEEVEQEEELELEAEQQQHVTAATDLVPERASQQKYARDDTRTIGWPVSRLREESGEWPPPYFYPLQEFRVFKGVGRNSAEPLQFPGSLLVSDNYYRRQWRLRSVRRLRAAVVFMEWSPKQLQAEEDPPESGIDMEMLYAGVREAFGLYTDQGFAEPTLQPHSISAMCRSLVPGTLSDYHAAEAVAADLAAADSKPAFGDVYAAVLRQRKAHLDSSRVHVLLTLEEAEHLQAAMPVLAGADVALRALPLRALRTGSTLQSAHGYSPLPPSHARLQEAEACVRLANADCGQWTEVDVAAARCALQRSAPDARRAWFADIRACKRRSVLQWPQLSVAPLFVHEDEQKMLAAKAMISRTKLEMVAMRMWPTDLFRQADPEGTGYVHAHALRDELWRLGVSAPLEVVASVVAGSAESQQGLSLAEFRDVFSVDDPDRDGIPEHLAAALIACTGRGSDSQTPAATGFKPSALRPPPPLLPVGGRFEVAAERCRSLRVVWTSRGTLCDSPLALWSADVPKSRPNTEWLPVCHYARPHWRQPQPAKDADPMLYLRVADRCPDGEPSLSEWIDLVFPRPVGYRLVWSLRAGGRPLYIWRPLPPSAEWTCLGDVATTSSSEPAIREVRCYPASWCVASSSLGSGLPAVLWADSGAAARAQSCWAVNCVGGLQFAPAGETVNVQTPRPGRYFANPHPPPRDSDSDEDSDGVDEYAAETVPMRISSARVHERQSLQGQVYYSVDVVHSEPRPGQPDRWRLWKGFNMFVDLRARCVQRGFDAPFPRRTLLIARDEDLDERRAGLDLFLQQIVEQAKMSQGWTLRPLITDFATDQGAYCLGAQCVVCGRTDRPGSQRKSGFKCNGCKRKRNRKLADITAPQP